MHPNHVWTERRGKKATETIFQVREKLGDVRTKASNIKKFLNSNNKYELEELGISDRTTTILEFKKVLTKRNLIDQLEEKCETLELGVNRFFNRIEALIQKGFPIIYVINDTQEDYVVKMKEVARSSIKFSGIKGSMTTRAFLKTMGNHLFNPEWGKTCLHNKAKIFKVYLGWWDLPKGN